MKYTKGPWHACQNGECSCKRVWCDDNPVAEVIAGKWGDDYCSIRIVGESSLDLKAEAYMEQITYGEIPEKEAIANANLISAAPDMYEALKNINELLEEIAPAFRISYRGTTTKIEQALAKAEGKGE